MPGKDTAMPTDCQERKKQKEKRKKLLKIEHKLYFKQVSGEKKNGDCGSFEPGQLGASHHVSLLRHSSLWLAADHIFCSISEEMLNQ